MHTRGLLVAEAAAELSAAGFTEVRRRARRLIAEALAISQTELFGHPDRAVEDWQIGRVQAMLRRAIAGEPLSRIFGKREFWGLEFALSADTFDPRPETETVVESVLRRRSDRGEPLRFLDLGTGTGCLLLALLSEFPAASGVGIDIAEGAVRTAICNSNLLGFAGRAHFFVADWADAVSASFDVVVANPPYIATRAVPLLPREVASHDPGRALDGGKDGLRPYQRIAEAAANLIRGDGMIAAEIGAGQAEAVAAMIKFNGLHVEAVDKDLAGIARCVVARRAPYGG
jgi:release factor glutamine methyltransferase